MSRLTRTALLAFAAVSLTAGAEFVSGLPEFAGDGVARPMAGTARAEDRMEPLPDELEGIGITEHLGARVPPDLIFTDETGEIVRIGDYFDGKKPVVLNLVYYTCPMLCTLVLNGVTDAMTTLEWLPGEQFEVVTVSIDPSETPSLARTKKESYLEAYGRPAAAAGWHFLVGTQENIRALADTVGFAYRYDEASRQFIHTAATFLISPDGRITRYLYGIEYEPQTFKLALLEAGQGKIGSSLDHLILYCFHYDAESGRYAPVAVNIMRVGGALTVVVLAVVLFVLWMRDLRRRRGVTATGVQA